MRVRPSADSSETTRLIRETLPAKNTPDSSTPTSTPMARSRVATTTATVASITTEEGSGLLRRARSERQEKVLSETMIITAVSAATGTRLRRSCSSTSSTSRKAPATRVESRPRAPDETLMTDWPIMAQPPMPPNTAELMLASPWPMHSRFLELPVSVMSSTICAVSRLSRRPTAARVAE